MKLHPTLHDYHARRWRMVDHPDVASWVSLLNVALIWSPSGDCFLCVHREFNKSVRIHTTSCFPEACQRAWLIFCIKRFCSRLMENPPEDRERAAGAAPMLQQAETWDENGE